MIVENLAPTKAPITPPKPMIRPVFNSTSFSRRWLITPDIIVKTIEDKATPNAI